MSAALQLRGVSVRRVRSTGSSGSSLRLALMLTCLLALAGGARAQGEHRCDVCGSF